MSERRSYDPWFLAAWVFLVVVVAFGFLLQARTIQRIERDERVVEDLVMQTQTMQTTSAESLCGLLVIIDTDDRALIVKTFRDLGYQCNPP